MMNGLYKAGIESRTLKAGVESLTLTWADPDEDPVTVTVLHSGRVQISLEGQTVTGVIDESRSTLTWNNGEVWTRDVGVDVLKKGVAEHSREWIENVDEAEVHELKRLVGEEEYDEACTSYLTRVITSRVGLDAWWVDTFYKDPLVANLVEDETREEIQQKWDTAGDSDLAIAPAPQSYALLRGIRNVWGFMKKSFRKLSAYSKTGASSKQGQQFRDKLQRIRTAQRDEKGKQETICDLDMTSLKLLPWSRQWHDDVRDHDTDNVCKSEKCPHWASKKALGAADAERVVRATQMAVYQNCYFKCVRFVAKNFEKTAMGIGNEGVRFCEMAHDVQVSLIGDVGEFMGRLVGNKESDIYSECSMLFAEDDAAAELLDFAIEMECNRFRRPTPWYTQTESPPLTLFREKRKTMARGIIYNEPICRPKGRHAIQIKDRVCPEGTHCLCQRTSKADHVAAPKRKSGPWKNFDMRNWMAADHCSMIRPSGPEALVWIDAAQLMRSKQFAEMRKFRAANQGNKVGLALIVAGAIYFAVSMSWHMAAWTWITSTAGPWLMTKLMLPIGAKVAISGAGAGSFFTAGVGPAIVIASIGLMFCIHHASFDCSSIIGCYPLKCEFDERHKQCSMSRGDTYSDEGSPNWLWWVPPSGLGCKYASSKWYKRRKCNLLPCTKAEMAKSMIGYFESPQSKSNTQIKFEFLNCQPLNVKDMSGEQQSEFLMTLNNVEPQEINGRLRENARVQRAARELGASGKQYVPECLTDAPCRVGIQEGDPSLLPYCEPATSTCRKPIITEVEVEIYGDNGKNTLGNLKAALAAMVLDSPMSANSLEIVEAEAETSPIGSHVVPDLHNIPSFTTTARSIADEALISGGATDLKLGGVATYLDLGPGECQVGNEEPENDPIANVGSEIDCRELCDSPDSGCHGYSYHDAPRGSMCILYTEDNLSVGKTQHEGKCMVKKGSERPRQVSFAQLGVDNATASMPHDHQTKKFRLVVRPDANLNDANQHTTIRNQLQKHVVAAEYVTSEKLRMTRLLGKDYGLIFKQVGTVCPARAPVDFSTHVCGMTKSGFGCDLKCESGFQAHSNIVCTFDGRWSDQLTEHGTEPESAKTPVYRCSEVTCPPLRLPATFCPRSVKGCFKWAEESGGSSCERGGLSGTQPYCQVQPTKGYYLGSIFNKWRCTTDKKWVLEAGTLEPEIKEWRCHPAHAISDRRVDYDSGVESICDHGYSGLKAQGDASPGKCDVTCKRTFEPVGELLCSDRGEWSGKAACQKILCNQAGLNSSAVIGAEATVRCPGGVLPAGEVAEGRCEVSCTDGFKLQTNDLACRSDGNWMGRVVCKANVPAGSPGRSWGDAGVRDAIEYHDEFYDGLDDVRGAGERAGAGEWLVVLVTSVGAAAALAQI